MPLSSMNLLAAAEVDPARPWTWTFIGLTFALYLVIGWLSRVRETAGFYVAGQGVPAIANGAATAADWMSAASFIGMAGLISFSGSDGSVYLMGWTGGYVLLALLLAPYLRKFGHYTVPDFIGARYYSETARVVAAICAIFVSLTYVAGQMKGVGVVFSRFLEVDLTVGVVIGMAIVAFFAVLGGMKGITWTQVAQYFVLIVAFIIPSVAISMKLTGSSIPQTAFVFSDISERLNDVLLELGEQEYTKPFGKFSQLNVFCITAALMFGTAGLPHVIVRFYTVKNVRAARYSAIWAIFFIALLYTTAPALGLFARYNLIKSLHLARIERVEVQPAGGESKVVSFAEDRAAALSAIRDAAEQNRRAADDSSVSAVSVLYYLVSEKDEALDWATRWQSTGLLVIDDLNQDGVIDLKLVKNEENGKTVLKSELAKIDKDIIVLSTPEVAGLPPWVIALVAAGGLAAALSTAAGLLLVISSSLAHDLYVRFFAPQATEAQRVLIGRIAIIVGILAAGYFGINPPGFVGEVVAFAFGLAAASFFPAIFLGIFFKRANRTGAVAGMIVGLVFTMVYIVLCTADKVLPMFFDAPILPPEKWLFGISPQGIGTLGMALNFAVTIVISSLTPPPPQEVLDLVEQVRVPSGAGEASGHE
ncbi:MAG TPA: cation acetate symporter [Planctomycetaceae bacterium]|nr:cation acetate symporter [Blastopirellula sp.]HAY83270.1 cation acetate symporter [Planctomycetaceae bacterium]